MPILIRHVCGVLVCLVGLLVMTRPTLAQQTESKPKPNARAIDSLRRALARTQARRTQDPALGYVPEHRLSAARQALAAQQRTRRQARAAAATNWTERGPLGISGTIRTLLIDPLDSTHRKVWAGSLVAGLWVNTDITHPDSAWRCVSDGWDNRSIVALASDSGGIASGRPQVHYALTSAGLDHPGNGLWKSTDGGVSWARAGLGTSAMGGVGAHWRQPMGALVVGRDHAVFAATLNGLLRSADGGVNWQTVLAPQQNVGGQPVVGGYDQITDLEKAQDGQLYAATATGRLFRSQTSAGTSWTEITPPGTSPYVGVRTELALSGPGSGTTTQQALYAISVGYNEESGGFTDRWLRRSTDGGQTWQAMTRPVATNYGTDEFTLGFGDTYLTLTAAPHTDSLVYLTAYDQLYRSTNGGRSWSVGTSIDRTTALLPIDAQRVVWGSDVAVYQADDVATVAQQGYSVGLHIRTKGWGGLAGVGTALRNTTGSLYRLVGGSGEPGLLELGSGTAPAVSLAAYPLRPILDEDTPELQLATTAGDGFLWRNTAQQPDWTYASTSLTTGNTAFADLSAYDTHSNTLIYWADKYVAANFARLDMPPTFAPVATTLVQPTYLKAGNLPNTLLVGTVNGEAYKLTGTHQTTVTHRRLAADVFPVGSTISGIDVGGNDDEYVVTLSNYGVASVWYTANGGLTWANKDEVAFGLPDMPIYGLLTNPANRRLVMLATELGVWATDDIAAPNPNWHLVSPAMPLIRVTQLTRRPADGRVAATTAGRGVWETAVWTTSAASPTLVAGPLSQTALCAGSTLTVSFTLANGSGSVQARLSDGQGMGLSSARAAVARWS
jgi:trimeric autotransporter adhesin